MDEILDTPTHGATYSIFIGDERFVRRSGTNDGVTSSRHAIESSFFATATVPGPYVPILV